MGKHKKNKVKKEKTPHVYRTLEERKAEVRKIIEKLEELNLSKDYETIKEDTDRDFYMSPTEAIEYGIIDNVFSKRPINSV